MKYKEPITCLKKELDGWKEARKNIREAIYRNDSSIGSDNTHRFYVHELGKCDTMILVYKAAIKKLKSK